jgi:vacuolar protein sorting-associated protein 16
MALSPNGRFLALYTSSNGSGRIWVVYSDFQKGISDFTIPASSPEADGPVRQIAWVGDDAVAVTWEGGRVVVMGPTGGYLEYFYNEGVWVIEDLDGLRMYSSTTCEFVQKVPGTFPPVCAETEQRCQRGCFQGREFVAVSCLT